MTDRETGQVTLELDIAARPETVFALLAEPEQMVRWMGRTVARTSPGGSEIRVDINGRDIARATYLELEPNRRIVFTWGWEGDGHPIPPDSSTVEVLLTPRGDGTLLRLIHSGLPAAAVADHTKGWGHYVDRLAIVAAGRDPGPDPVAMAAARDEAGAAA